MEEHFDFYRRVAIVCAHIPDGKVTTYGQIALLCGKPRNSRQAGYCLRNNLAGEAVKAYRVVNSKGRLSGAGYFETWDLQKLLLEQDGISAVWTGDQWKVDLKVFGWKNSMAEAEELRRIFLELGI